MAKLTPILLLLALLPTNNWAQQRFGIKIPATRVAYNSDCGRLEAKFLHMAKEVSFGVTLDDQKRIYFEFNNREWLTALFQNPFDGMAIDIVTKDLYACDAPVVNGHIRGELLPPLYRENIKKRIQRIQEGYYGILLGKLPLKYHNKDLEFNIIFLQNRSYCRYQTTYKLQSYNYDLLDMGIYLDSITYNPTNANSGSDAYATKYKKLSFKVPFEKNKTTFTPEDIKPLYDSLRLTDYNIKKIDIKAYSSIEGSLERNQELQQKRSQSIITALQSFQKATMETEVSTAENWVEFLDDIEGTEYDFLKSLGKAAVKQTVVGEVAEQLEPYLKNHRKAVIAIYLEKIDQYQDLSENELVTAFNSAIANEQLDRAAQLQYSLFQKLRNNTSDPDLLDQMVIPKQKRFVDFFNATSAFRYEMDRANLISAYYDFQELHKWAPENKKIAYNMIALKLRLNHLFQSIPEEDDSLEKISSLETLGISKKLLDRMRVNYHITKSELLMRERKYEDKDKSVRFILDTYKNLPLSDADYLSLAQYVTYYYDTETAIDLLREQVAKIEVDKRLLFYYLNLTLINDAIVAKPAYRKIMLNAINLDKKRFCKLFEPSNAGGVTFQLLDNTFLKRTYCENCVR